MKRSLVGIFCLLAALARSCPARADLFVLTNGGQITGELLNPDEKPRKAYAIGLPSGGRISLDASQVKQVVASRPELAEYERIRPQYPDTVEGQGKLAEWCRQQKLITQSKTHLRRILELDPDHADARRILGYSKTDGQWMTEEERKTKQGYVRYKGEWKLPQEVELLEGRRKQEDQERAWFQRLSQWRGWLGTERAKQAKQRITSVDDSMALKALALYLKKESSPDVRLLYLAALEKIHTPESIGMLAICAIEDSSEEVRLSSLDLLEKNKNAAVVAYFVGKLRHKENVMVNRAAVALSRMKDPSSVAPLIDALITTHLKKVGGGSPGQTTTTFPTGGTPGGGGISMGQGPALIRYHVTNQPVLDALVTITGQNFNFDQRAWRTWYAARSKSQKLDARRN